MATEAVGHMVIVEKADALLKKAGLSTDRRDHRVSSNFARDLVRGGLSEADALIALNQESIRAGLLDLDETVSGGISDRQASARAAKYIDDKQDSLTQNYQTSNDPAIEEILVIGERPHLGVGPSGKTITEKLFTGGVQLLDGLTTLSEKYGMVASVGFEAARGVLTGGPLKTVITKLAKSSLDGAVEHGANLARNAAAEFVTSLDLNVQLSIAGNKVNFDASMFGAAAGELAGGAVETIGGKGLDVVSERGTSVRKMVSAGDYGTYGDLAARSKKDGLSVDHIPSHASNVKVAEARLGRQLTSQEDERLRHNAGAMVVADGQHQKESRTYGGRNNQSQQQYDAANPNRAIDLDMAKHAEYLRKLGKTDQQIQESINYLKSTRSKLLPDK